MAKLYMENITAGYVEGIDILRDVSIEVVEGTITGIIGANGAGKSTLLKTIFGFLHPRQGKIVFQGKEIQNHRPYQMKEMGISYMLQEYSTFPELSIQDNLLLGAWTFRKDKKRVNRRLNDIYEFFPVLSDRRAEKAGNLSGGARNVSLVHMTKTLATQVGKFGITVNCIHPGTTRTERTPSLLEARAKALGVTPAEAEIQDFADGSPRGNHINRMVDASEIGYLTAYLASDKSWAVTGEVIAAGGGTGNAVFY